MMTIWEEKDLQDWNEKASCKNEIERKCDNCLLGKNRLLTICQTTGIKSCYHFMPNEKLVRQDERNKFLTLLKSDLENFDGLADECVERKDIHELLESNAVRKYIESTIELLEKRQ